MRILLKFALFYKWYLPHGGATTVIINVDSGRAVLEVRSDSV